ncbi:MAG: UTP--glucose-1-phosphate uridylyltransferase GalU [Firmicutes bacterium]|nr:UTP--glucose-1-phosphate uridylyltransferase GalU [Bacillota bacterium]
MRVRKAVIPAAGWGTRFLPATKAQPKEMLPIVDKPAIQYIIEEAVASGIEDIIFITGRNKKALEDHFDRAMELEVFLQEKGRQDLAEVIRNISNLADINYVRQKEAKGLGHAILCARKFIGSEPFAIMLPDDIIASRIPCLKQMMKVYKKTGGSVVAVKEVPEYDVNKFGIIKGEPTAENLYRIDDLVEKPALPEAPSRLAVIGRYIVSPRVLDLLEKTKPGANGEIQLTDALRQLCKLEKMFGFKFEGTRFDVGDKLGFLQANVRFALGNTEFGDAFQKFLEEELKGTENKRS